MDAGVIPARSTDLVFRVEPAGRDNPGVTKVAGIYTRVSFDPRDTRSSTDRQERLCRAWITEQGWVVGDVFCDNDRSAFLADDRPEFERLLATVARGHLDAIVCWKLDRLTRQPRQLERVVAVCELAKVAVVSVTEPVDTSTPTGLALVRLLITFAGMESHVRSERLRARERERAERGLPHAGRVGFGHTAGCAGIVEAEATLIREAADRVLSGESVTTIVADWRGRQILGTRGVPWSDAGLRSLLQAHRLAGNRSYHGEVVAERCFPAILDPLVAARVRLALAARPRRRRGGLLQGLLRCGVCGRNLRANGAGDRHMYACQPRRPARCGRVAVTAAHVEGWVVAQVLWRLERRWPRNGRQPPRPDIDDVISNIEDLRKSLHRLNRAFFIERLLSAAEYTRTRDELLADAGVVHAHVAPPAGLPAALDLRRIRELWPALHPDHRRSVIELELASLVVHPARVRNRFQPDRLEPTWLAHLADVGTALPPTIDWAPPVRSARPGFSPAALASASELTRAELIATSDLNYQQVARAERSGRLVALDNPGPKRYSRQAVDAYLASRRTDGMLTRADAARYLGWSTEWLATRTARGDLVCRWINGRTWYSQVDLDAYLQRQQVARRGANRS